MDNLWHSWSFSSESQSQSIELESQDEFSDSSMDLEVLSNEFTATNIKLWEFLIEILEDKRFRTIIKWTASHFDQFHDNEFNLIDPREVARLYAIRSNRPFSLSYNKFNRILRSYYNKKKILQKINGKSNTFSFKFNILPYLNKLRMCQ